LAEMRAQKERQLEGNNQRDSNRPLLPLPKLSDRGASEKTSDVSGQWGWIGMSGSSRERRPCAIAFSARASRFASRFFSIAA
jgi:hypothetical protein